MNDIIPMPRQRSSEGGFALIEALISLILLATVLALLPGTIRMGKRAWQAADAQSNAVGNVSALSVVEHRMQSAMPVFERGQSGLPRLAFDGRSDSLSFVAPLSEGPAGGGLYKFTLAIRAGSANSDQSEKNSAGFAAELVPFQRGELETLAPVRFMVMSEIVGVEFRYFGTDPKSGERTWHANWPSIDRLPSLVELTLRSNKFVAPSQRRVALKLQSSP